MWGSEGPESGRAGQIGQSGVELDCRVGNDADSIMQKILGEGKEFWLLWNWKKTLSRLEGSWVRERHDKSYALERLI